MFCERIFGPINDYECACGKKPQYHQKFCPECEVEYTTAKVRRYRLGYIQLIVPISHIWYIKGRPSYLSILFNFSRKKTESIVYCTQFRSIIFSEYNSGHHLISNLELPIIPCRSDMNLPKVKSQLFKLKTQSIINKFIKQKRQYALVNKRLIESLHIKISQCSLNNKIEEKYSDPMIQLRFHYWSDNSYSFIQHYFCINHFFTFEDLNHCFYFNIYTRSFIFPSDSENYLYKDDSLINSDSTDLIENNQTGSLPLYNLLSELEIVQPKEYYNTLLKLERQIRIVLLDFKKKFLSLNTIDKLKLIQRIKIIRYFRQKSNNPSWMILLNLPVLPPDLRPILQLGNDQIAISDLNKLYQKVIFRNKRLQRLLQNNYGQTVDEIQYAHRLLQESVDALIENGKNGATPLETNNNRALKSLSDILKGKRGRFRQNLLGKRVDYSGRSVIVVGPNLKLHECGIPIEMAIELFRPFIIKYLLIHKKAKTIIGAKQLLSKNSAALLPIVKQIIQGYPVLLNRAPTLHRLSVQAFQPVLVTGKSILLHPLVCSAFNADFDGDQMAIHIPLSFQARSEAWKLLWSINNFISPATGQPILAPSQDMVLGCYFLTLYQVNAVKLSSQLLEYPFKHIWILWNQTYECDQKYQNLIEIRVDNSGKYSKIYPTVKKCFNVDNSQYAQYIFTTIGRLILHNLINEWH